MKKVTSALSVSLLLSACGGGGGGGGSGPAPQAVTAPTTSSTTTASVPIVVPAALNNIVPVFYDGYTGPSAQWNAWNRPTVDVTICNSSNVCSTLTNIVLDTASYGLRIDHSVVPPGFPALPPLVDSQFGALANCADFISGYMWGGVYTATVKMGGEVAANIPVMVYNDPNVSSTAPTNCTSASPTNIGNVNDLGGNGILGVGPQLNSGTASYYSVSSCNASSSCAEVTVPESDALPNPVSAFAADYNGFILIPQGNGVAASSTSNLVFGINTQSNNQVTGYTIVNTNVAGNVNVAVTDTSNYVNNAISYFDTGTVDQEVYLANPQPTYSGEISNGIDANLTLPLTISSPIDTTSYTGSFLTTKASTDFSSIFLSIPGITSQLTAKGVTVLGSAYYLSHSVAEILPSPGATVGTTNYYRSYGIK